MVGEWQVYALGELTINYDGRRKPVKESERQRGPYPYYGASGVVDYVDDYLIDGDFLLVAEDGENLRTRQTPIAFMARGKSWVNNHAHIVTGNDKADTQFLMYALQAMDISGYLTGAVMPKLTQGNLNKIEITCPPIEEQRAIAYILGTLDDKIELNRQMNETLEATAGALFKSWFVDFDPVRAKIEGRWKRGKSLLGLPAHDYDIFPDSLINSELGDLPKGWEKKPLSSFTELVTCSMSPAKHPETLFEHYSIPAFDSERMPRMELGKTIKSNKYVVQQDAILVSKLNPQTPRVWLPSCRTEHAVCSTEFMQFVAEKRENKLYFYCLMTSKGFQNEVLKHVTGSTGSRQRAKPSKIVCLDVIWPTPDVLSVFNQHIDPFLRNIALAQLENENLTRIRDTLLPKLISGELRVKDAEKSIGDTI